MATTYPNCVAVMNVLLQGVSLSDIDKMQSYEVIPKSVSIERNSYRAADTFSMDIDYKDFPLDPRTVSSILITIYLGDTQTANTTLLKNSTTEAFIGYVDEPETRLSKDGETVSFRGRDFTSLFLDFRWTGAAIDLNMPFSTAIQKFIDTIPSLKEGDVKPVFMDPSIGSTNLGSILSRTKWATRPQDDAWTVLSDLCGALGTTPVYELDDLKIHTADTFYNFRNTVYFKYGQNILTLNYKRNYTESKTVQVRAICWDAKKRELSTAIYPTVVVPRQRISKKKKKLYNEPIPYMDWYVPGGGYSTADLLEIAKGVYEKQALEQIEGEMETAEMYDLLGNPVWQLKNGDTIILNIGGATPYTYQELIGKSSATAANEFLKAGSEVQRGAALLFSKAWAEAEKFQATFYVKRARHEWSRDRGYTLNVEFIN